MTDAAPPVAPVPVPPPAPVASAPETFIQKVEAEAMAVEQKVVAEVKALEAEAWGWIKKNAVAIKAKLEMIL